MLYGRDGCGVSSLVTGMIIYTVDVGVNPAGGAGNNMAPFAWSVPENTHGPIVHPDGSIDVRVRHHSKIRVKTTYPEGRIDIETMEIDQLEGHLLVLGAIYNVSGYYNPMRPTVKYWFLNKKRAFLKAGELCDCKECKDAK